MTKLLVKEKRELWKQKHPTIKKWLGNMKEGTEARYVIHAYEYFMWIEKKAPEPFGGKSPEQLLDMQETTRGRKQYDQVDLLQAWINSKQARYSTKQLMKSTIYSFYLHNRVPLPKDITFKIEADRPAVNGEMTVEELRQIILSSNELYQAIFTIMWQSGMGEEEFIYFNTHLWNQVKEQLDKGETIIRIDLPGRKHQRMKPSGNFFTFIGKDGIDKLRKYLIIRKKLQLRFNRTMPMEKAIFLNEKLRPISKQDITAYFCRHSWRLGITKKVDGDKRIRYRVHVHEMRDAFKTELETIPLLKSYCIEFWLGHNIDTNQYHKLMNKPEFVKSQYKKAEPYLNILSEEPRTVAMEELEEVIERRVNERLKAKMPLDLEKYREVVESRKNLQEKVEQQAQQIKAILNELRITKLVTDKSIEEWRNEMEELRSELNMYRDQDLQDQDREMREEYARDPDAFRKKYDTRPLTPEERRKKQEEAIRQQPWLKDYFEKTKKRRAGKKPSKRLRKYRESADKTVKGES